MIFPAAAALAWAVLGYVCIDFGFWDKIFDTSPQTDQIWRAGAETALAATLLVFLFAYLNLNRWHVRASRVAIGWLLFLVALIGLAIFDAPVAAGVARISLATIAAVGFILVLYLSTHGYDRAVMLIPTWFLLLVWIVAAAFTVTGSLTNDLVSPALIGGLVLIVMLIGFTVMQNAFAGGGLAHGAISDAERKALALTGCGDIIFDWDVPSDRVYVSPEVETQLGLARGALEGAASAWLDLLHPFERDRYRACLDTMLEQRRGRINQEFRLRAADGHYFWFHLKARPVIGPDGEVIRVIGTLADVTEKKMAADAAPARRGPRQSDRTAEPRTVLRSARGRASPFPDRREHSSDRHLHRYRPVQADQRNDRLLGGRFDSAHGSAPARPHSQAAR